MGRLRILLTSYRRYFIMMRNLDTFTVSTRIHRCQILMVTWFVLFALVFMFVVCAVSGREIRCSRVYGRPIFSTVESRHKQRDTVTIRSHDQYGLNQVFPKSEIGYSISKSYFRLVLDYESSWSCDRSSFTQWMTNEPPNLLPLYKVIKINST